MKNLLCKEGFLHRFVGFSESFPDQIAIRHLDAEEDTVTYRGLRIKAEECKGALKALDVLPGDKVALVLPNGVEFIAYYLAIIGSGAIPVILNYKLTSFEMTSVISSARPTLVVTTETLFEQHRELFQPAYGVRHSLVLNAGREPSSPLPDNATADSRLPRHGEPLLLPEGNPIVSVQFTYRGIGRPLAVSHRYLDLTQSSDGLHEQFHPQGIGSVHLVTLPLYAIFGLSVMMVFPLSVGATLLMTNTLLNRDLAEVLSEHKVSFACLVPDVIRYFNTRLAKRKGALLPMHPQLMIYSGGSHLPADEAEKLGRLLGCNPVLQGYGLTESMPVIVQSSIGKVHRGAMGQPISGVELRVVDAQGRDVVPGRIGELLIRGSMVIDGYNDAEEANARFFREGWLHTGDLVWRDDDGHVFFYCQRLRISKIKAQMVDLTEIESVALKHPGVVRAKAFIVPDNKEVNVLHLCVEGHGDLTQNTVSTLLARDLSGFKLPRTIEIISLKEETHAS
ncbi:MULTISPECIES: class I adenylate-forming enzyme family protein [Pseudomonas]|uniref:Acyl--CoA ligase n=1 Tax=Pseudomonas gingeri TaxID=117681 RepID=A0A7Y7WLE7_9PSED|nr:MULTISPECIES: class I adenylate-forming enzyme family protein [Pseudomonas]MPQ67930.1 AMP-binding protein [Pseudomonas sp. MWU12-2323]NWB83564.1 acyl--CoA ligase [Pseudomonas gingeri]RBH55999.1 long-chain fatty acid--CoA ligase [Pseudomonas sp. MWU13-2860]